jgi:hypothetical protein
VGGRVGPVAGAGFPCADVELIGSRRVSKVSTRKIRKKKTRGVVTAKIAKNSSSEQQGFCTGDVLWAVGIWSVILTLSPVVIFYVLMVN